MKTTVDLYYIILSTIFTLRYLHVQCSFKYNQLLSYSKELAIQYIQDAAQHLFNVSMKQDNKMNSWRMPVRNSYWFLIIAYLYMSIFCFNFNLILIPWKNPDPYIYKRCTRQTLSGPRPSQNFFILPGPPILSLSYKLILISYYILKLF